MSARAVLAGAFARAEALIDRAVGPGWNPLAQLGALGWFLFWIVVVSGIYLYIFFDTGIAGTYSSIEAITHSQWWAGGVMRSLHRYASDALVIMALLHLLREYANDRLRGNHWFAWLSGLPLLLFIYVCGITGYWLVWDTLAQYVAQTTSTLLDALPLFGEPVARNFLNEATLSNRFFTLMVFIHIAAPLLMLLFMWVHISRHAQARVNPSRFLGVTVLAALLLLSLLHPALSQPPANLDTVPAVVGLDWFYLAAYPLADQPGPGWVWLGGLALLLLLTLLPWLPRRPSPPAAVVSLPDCNGCGRCYADCPFEAITLAARSDGLPYAQEAVVDPDRCIGCGICVGACPTATPFRSAPDFVAGIEVPQLPLTTLREQVRTAAAGLAGEARVIVFDCGHGAPTLPAAGTPTAVVAVPCVGMLPPSFIDYVLTRRLADGVLLAGCAQRDCHHRLGDWLTEQRVAGKRNPWLRERIPRERVAVSWAGRAERRERAADLAAFSARLAGQAPLARGAGGSLAPASRRERAGWPRPWRWSAVAVLLAAMALPVGAFDNWPTWRQLQPGEAVVRLSFSHSAAPRVACRQLSPEELLQLKPNMRRQVGCPRERWPVYVELELDGRPLYRGTHLPAGLWDDGPSTVFERFAVPAGSHRLTARLRDSGREQGFDHEATRSVQLVAEQNFVIEFRSDEGFVFR